MLRLRTKKTNNLQLELRRKREGIIVVQASNDTVVDAAGTVITVEALNDWAAGFIQHRTVNLQHSLNLRGIQGKPQVGMGMRVDFTPQLEVEVRVDDPEVDRMIDRREITGASLEFLPVPEHIERRSQGGESFEVYHRLSSEPELCALALCDIPAVPGSDILELRAVMPNWAYAVIDPRVVNGEITDPALIERLRWLPHHDPVTHTVDHRALERALADLQSITVPPEASLTREQVITRATAHLDRHSRLGLGVRAKGESMHPKVKRWLELRAQQYEAEGLSREDAAAKAEGDLGARPQLRTELERPANPEQGFLERLASSLNINIYGNGQPVQTRTRDDRDRETERQPDESQPEQAERTGENPPDGNTRQNGNGNGQNGNGQQDAPQTEVNIEQRVNQAVDARVNAIMAQPENPMAAMAFGGARPRTQMDGQEILMRALAATIVPQMQRRALDSGEVEKTYRMLEQNGIERRALTIEANGTIIREELARQFIIKPYEGTVGRNLFRSVPMGNAKKIDFPRFDRAGLLFEWNRSGMRGPKGSTDYIDESQPRADTFPIEVSELNGAVRVPDSFLDFNISGAAFVSNTLLPEMRAAAQWEEDKQFFRSTGLHPDPASFVGIMRSPGAVVIEGAANGDLFSLGLLGSLLRRMPKPFRANRRRLAYFVSSRVADDFVETLTNRVSPVGDAYLTGGRQNDGLLTPIGFYLGVPMYEIPHLSDEETQGTSTDAATLALVNLDIPVIGDSLMLKMEPWRDRGFQSVLQLQEYVGLGYQWEEGIVRRGGVRPATFA